ncbi:hypothetical protein AMTR_s00169p00063360 [Amborella trichopoda]|uniref:Uncharacterized protein n=1 Tax=Amborella trichopoda TaxID=13333 RepID=W1PSB6_AMBTC|nr:hypothetical protein AMTR_s00169p00063360 [Amborella trichopoda]
MIRWAAFFLLLTTNAQSPETESPPSYDYFFLQDILRKISDIEQWRLDRVRLSSLDVKNAKISAAQRYEFILQIGGNSLALKFNDERLSWEKLHRKSKQASKGSDIFEPQMVKIMQRRPSLKPFKLEGPLEMHIHGSGEPQLILPFKHSRLYV